MMYDTDSDVFEQGSNETEHVFVEDLKTGRMVSRRYRNRRIGEFLKELEFTEGRRTGIPKIRRALKNNGSPEPRFYTDGARLSFWAETKIHPTFLKEDVFTIENEAQVEGAAITEMEQKILILCQYKPSGNKEILQALGYKTLTGHVKKAPNRLKKMEALVYMIPDKPRSQHQKYKITEYGFTFIKEKFRKMTRLT